jgi:hypothetical protein
MKVQVTWAAQEPKQGGSQTSCFMATAYLVAQLSHRTWTIISRIGDFYFPK